MFWYNITPAAIVRNVLYVTRVLYSLWVLVKNGGFLF